MTTKSAFIITEKGQCGPSIDSSSMRHVNVRGRLQFIGTNGNAHFTPVTWAWTQVT